MENEKLQSLLLLILPQVAQLIVENQHVDDTEAMRLLYRSKLYAALEDEGTKLWHLSPLTLYNMFAEEQKTGELIFPEEV